MNDLSNLRERVRELINAGKLLDRRPDRLRVRWGAGTDCIVCDESVTRDQFELEIEFDRKGMVSGVDKNAVHIDCLAAWELEVAKTRRRPGAISGRQIGSGTRVP